MSLQLSYTQRIIPASENISNSRFIVHSGHSLSPSVTSPYSFLNNLLRECMHCYLLSICPWNVPTPVVSFLLRHCLSHLPISFSSPSASLSFSNFWLQGYTPLSVPLAQASLEHSLKLWSPTPSGHVTEMARPAANTEEWPFRLTICSKMKLISHGDSRT